MVLNGRLSMGGEVQQDPYTEDRVNARIQENDPVVYALPSNMESHCASPDWAAPNQRVRAALRLAGSVPAQAT